MSDNSSKKIDIINEEEEKGVEVKKSPRYSSRKERQDKVEDEIADFYKNDDFNQGQKVNKAKKGTLLLMMIWSIVFGLIAGTAASIFFLTHESLNLPFIGEISLTRYFPTRELTIKEEKNVTVLAETRVEELIKEIPLKTWRIFKKKSSQDLPFLEQVYAPWQTIGLGVILNSQGWMVSNAEFDNTFEYIVLDQDNNLYPIEKILKDEISQVSFIKISGNEFSEIKTAFRDDISSGQQIVVYDKFSNYHFTEINQPQKIDVFQTEDLVRSTDKYKDYLTLDAETSLSSFPQAMIFNLDKKLVGLVIQGRVVPFWHLEGIFRQVVLGKYLSYSFLGIDYLMVNEAFGLQSDKFKDLDYGAIVYGPALENSPALEAGIKNADVIIKVGEQTVEKSQDLTYLVQQRNPEEEIELTILRDGQEIVIRPILKALELKSEE